MALSRSSQNVVLDFVDGAVAFGLFYAGLRWAPDNNASILFLMTETIYFLAGTFRGLSNPPNSFVKLLAIGIPGICTILFFAYTGYAFTAPFYIFSFLGAAFLGTLSGILLRRLVATRKTGLGLLTALGVLAVSLLAVRVVIPRAVAASLSKDADLSAPPFTLSTIDGVMVSSDQLQGRVILLAFWATWCRPCIGELPRLQQVYQRYRNDPRVAIWAVDSGIGNDTLQKQRKMIAAEHWDMPFAQDSENLEHKMGLHGLPKLVLLDKTGRVRWIHDGFDGSEDLAGQIVHRIEALLGSD